MGLGNAKGLLLTAWLFSFGLAACHRQPADTKVPADVQVDVGTDVQALPQDVVEVDGDVTATTAADIAPSDDVTSTADVADAGPVCGTAQGACPAGATCCPKACPKPYPCVCAGGFTCGWAPMADGIRVRASAGSDFGGGKFWVVGGVPFEGPDEVLFESHWMDGEVYDPATNNWELLPVLPTRRTKIPRVVWGGDRLYVYGETPSSNELEPGEELLSYGAAWLPAQQKWKPLPLSGAPGRISGRPSAVWLPTTQKLAVFRSQPGKSSYYDPATDSWSPLPPPPSTGTGLEYQEAVWTGKFLLVKVGFALSQPPGTPPGKYATHILRLDVGQQVWAAFDGLPNYAGPLVSGDFVPAPGGMLVVGHQGPPPWSPLKVWHVSETTGAWTSVDLPSWWNGDAWGDANAHRVGNLAVLWVHGAAYDMTTSTWSQVPVGGPKGASGFAHGTDGVRYFVSHGYMDTYPYLTAVKSGRALLVHP